MKPQDRALTTRKKDDPKTILAIGLNFPITAKRFYELRILGE